MQVSYLPVLEILRELYSQPRDMARFRRYIAAMTGGGDDIILPIGVANPMAKDHALAKLHELLAMGAERIGAAAADEAQNHLNDVETVEIKASIVLVDDVAGGWTNRYTTEAMVWFPSRGALKRPFATALAWTSETPSTEQLRAEVLAAIFRVAYQQRFGLAVSLKERMQQEGLAAVFAGAAPLLSAQALNDCREVIHALGDNPPYPHVFAALYGDAAAEQLGYVPLGLPPRAGFEVALADAIGRRRDPVAALRLRSAL